MPMAVIQHVLYVWKCHF